MSQIDRNSELDLNQSTGACNNNKDGAAHAQLSLDKSDRVIGRLAKKRVCGDDSASSEDSTERSGAPKQRSEPADHI